MNNKLYLSIKSGWGYIIKLMSNPIPCTCKQEGRRGGITKTTVATPLRLSSSKASCKCGYPNLQNEFQLYVVWVIPPCTSLVHTCYCGQGYRLCTHYQQTNHHTAKLKGVLVITAHCYVRDYNYANEDSLRGK